MPPEFGTLALPGGLLDQILAVQAPALQSDVAPLPVETLLERILAAMSPLAATPLRAPRSFGEGFGGGLVRGVGGAGARIAANRARMEAVNAARQRDVNAANIRATERYQERRGTALREAAREQRGQHVVTEADVAANPGLQRFIGQAVPLEWMRPTTPSAPSAAKQLALMSPAEWATFETRYRELHPRRPRTPTGEPLVPVETPEGPVYMRRSEAVGMRPARAITGPPGTATAPVAESITEQAIRAARIAGVTNGKQLGQWLSKKLSSGKTRVQTLIERGLDLNALGDTFR